MHIFKGAFTDPLTKLKGITSQYIVFATYDKNCFTLSESFQFTGYLFRILTVVNHRDNFNLIYFYPVKKSSLMGNNTFVKVGKLV